MAFTPLKQLQNNFTPLGEQEPKKQNVLEGLSTGIAQGELSTLKGLGTIGQKALDQTVGRVVNAVSGKGFTALQPDNSVSDIYRPGTSLEQKASATLTPSTTSEKIGFATEQLAEFLVPAAKAARAEQAVDLISKGIVSPKAAALTRIVGKAAVQGIAAGGVKFAQTGGDVKQSAEAASTAGLLRGAMATIGEGARAIRLPERIYSVIFKNSKDDMLKELRAGGLANLQRTDPERFTQFVKDGIIKFGPTGEPTVNDTLAEQALDRGLRGSFRSMANEVVDGVYTSEAKAQELAKGFTGTIDVSEPQYISVLRKIEAEYQDVGFGEISGKAKVLADKLKTTNGQLSADDALDLRRFFDRMRMASSFDKPASSLSMTQSNFKTLSDTLRKRVNSIPGMRDVMKDYSFYIDALESLAKEAGRRGNNQLISLIDSIFLGGSLAEPATGIPLAILRRFILSAAGSTALGQALYKTTASPTLSGAIGAASSIPSSVNTAGLNQ